MYNIFLNFYVGGFGTWLGPILGASDDGTDSDESGFYPSENKIPANTEPHFCYFFNKNTQKHSASAGHRPSRFAVLTVR